MHDHSDESAEGRGKRLLIAVALNVGITVAQIVGGLISGSLSVLADAAHNASDAATLGISYGAWRLSRRKADERRTFGYKRAETVGAIINLTTLFVIALYLLYEAVDRFFNPQEVGGWVMIIVGAIAAVEDALSVWVLSKDQGSLNMKSAFLHMIADTMATVGVIVGGILILLFDITWVDPLITALIAVYIFVHGFREIRKTISVLMESAPKDFDFDGMVRAMKGFEGVEDIHHVHVWRPDEERLALEAHVAISERDLAKADGLKRRIKSLLQERFGVEHATLEVELAGSADHDHAVIRDE
ncbi:cation diffusion facilitator family transporter [Jiella pacifica]|uniref:Cation diffusion facilitator family transporter n=1 Tax=Jiella pacifica TaxID=2696469 RepID=A0A6N9T8T8_9HYPH|nr:cation diffusion facilitator family transporter [Jiella pacifica]NDW07854.1 cation diffusion facilitator family transporter [Jiella pacifica]